MLINFAKIVQMVYLPLLEFQDRYLKTNRSIKSEGLLDEIHEIIS